MTLHQPIREQYDTPTLRHTCADQMICRGKYWFEVSTLLWKTISHTTDLSSHMCQWKENEVDCFVSLPDIIWPKWQSVVFSDRRPHGGASQQCAHSSSWCSHCHWHCKFEIMDIKIQSDFYICYMIWFHSTFHYDWFRQPRWSLSSPPRCCPPWRPWWQVRSNQSEHSWTNHSLNWFHCDPWQASMWTWPVSLTERFLMVREECFTVTMTLSSGATIQIFHPYW